jgi:hypothetical protein
VQALQGFGGRVAPFETATALFGWFMVSGTCGARLVAYREWHTHALRMLHVAPGAALLLPILEKLAGLLLPLS